MMHSSAPSRSFSFSGRHWFVLGLLIFFAALSLQYTFKAIGNGERSNRSAFLRWREQIQDLPTKNIYQTYNYPNPPIMAILLFPLVQLPALLGSLLWFYLKLGLTAVAILWVFKMVESAEQPFPTWAKLCAVVLSLRPIMGDLSHGNVNLFILFLVVAALHALNKRQHLVSGLLLALAIACKVTPALFIPYLLWKRAWKSLAGCCIGLLLFLILIPGLFLGQSRNVSLLTSWTNQMVKPFVLEGAVTSDHPNQSLPGVVYRLLTHNPSYLDELGHPARFDNFANLDPRTAGRIVKGCMLLFMGFVVWSCRTPLQAGGGWRLAAEYSLVVVGMLLFSERTWKHHCVTMVLPFAVLCYYLAACRPAPLLRALVAAGLMAVFALMTATSTSGVSSALDEMARLAQVYGAYVVAYVILAGLLVVILKCKDGRRVRGETIN